MTVGSILEGAFRLLRERPGAVLIWMIINLAMGVAISYATVAILNGQFEAMVAGGSEASTAVAALSQTILLGVLTLMVTMVIYAAVLRAALLPAEGGPGALRLGMDEVRLFLLALLYLILFFVLMFVITYVVVVMAPPVRNGELVAALTATALSLALAAYLYTRLALSFPLTLMRKRFVIGEAWDLTKGRFWTLFAVYLILFAMLFCLSFLVGLVTEQEYFAAVIQGGFNSERAQQAALYEYQVLGQGGLDATIVLRWASGAVLGGLGVALFGGANATAVKELTIDQEGLSETFA